MAAADSTDIRAAGRELIASFKALELAASRRRRPVMLDPRRFFMAAFPLFEYLVFEEQGEGTRGSAPHLMREVDPHLVLAGRSCWRSDDGQLRVDLNELARADATADSRYYGACFWQAGALPLYITATGENRVDACAALGVSIRAQVHPMLARALPVPAAAHPRGRVGARTAQHRSGPLDHPGHDDRAAAVPPRPSPYSRPTGCPPGRPRRAWACITRSMRSSAGT